MTTTEKNKNADLIAEMLEALIEARHEISRLNQITGETVFNPAATMLVDAAITRATGDDQ